MQLSPENTDSYYLYCDTNALFELFYVTRQSSVNDNEKYKPDTDKHKHYMTLLVIQ